MNRRLPKWGWWVVFAILLAASHAVQWRNARKRAALKPPGEVIKTPAFTREGVREGAPPLRVHIVDLAPKAGGARARPPVVLLHGTPGSAANFAILRPLLQEAGYRVLAVDLPGFGWSSRRAPDFSMRAHARAVLHVLRERGIERAHLAGWSNGGGVALHMADLDPGAAATVTLMASIGEQRNEGSGDYYFEHFKYALGMVFIAALPEALPHFGLLGGFSDRYPFLANFRDSDQRSLGHIMRELRVPALILHGRHDFLVADWAAERHHGIAPGSRLVMMDASHFLPVLQAEETAKFMIKFLERHDEPGVPAEAGSVDLAPRRPPMLGGIDLKFREALLAAPWWLELLAIAAVTVASRYAAWALLGLLVPPILIDCLVALLGLILGELAILALSRGPGKRHREERAFRKIYHIKPPPSGVPVHRQVMQAVLRSIGMLILACVIAPLVMHVARNLSPGPLALLAVPVIVVMLIGARAGLEAVREAFSAAGRK